MSESIRTFPGPLTRELSNEWYFLVQFMYINKHFCSFCVPWRSLGKDNALNFKDFQMLFFNFFLFHKISVLFFTFQGSQNKLQLS